MRSLFRFEDSYGFADIFCSANGIHNDFSKNIMYDVNEDLYIEIGLGIV